MIMFIIYHIIKFIEIIKSNKKIKNVDIVTGLHKKVFKNLMTFK